MAATMAAAGFPATHRSPASALRDRPPRRTVRPMALEPLELISFKRNSMLTIDATINGLDGEPADLTGLTGDDIRWGIAARRGGPRLATVDLDDADEGTGDITITSASNGRIRVQWQPPLPPDDDDPFRAKNAPYWHECEVTLTEVTTTQFWGPVIIEPSIFAETA